MNQGYNNQVNNQSTSEMPANNMQASSPVNQNPQNPVVQVLPDGTQVLMDGTKMTPDGTKILPNGEKILADGTRIVDTNGTKANGQNKCPMCGSTEVRLNTNKGVLVCEFCRHEFVPEKLDGMVNDLSQLQGQVVASGASDIAADAKDQMTFKCSSCGAEVVIDTTESNRARCHWCRNTLSLNQQVPNGAVPDVVLPFNMKKEVAQQKINQFVGKRKFFAHPQFTKEFTTENIMGVYFPYMLVDINGHANLSGEAEIETRRYTVKVGDSHETRYDADTYHIEREFDLTIEDLSIESNSNRLDNSSKVQTNNIINSIMPFDTENCVKYNANYLRGYTSEKRDVNVSNLKEIVNVQAKDIARFAANDTMKQYDRGACWAKEDFKIKGYQWEAAYLPVWLYSYLQVKGNKKLLHYVAVNARTKETMGSVPINKARLLLVSFLIEILAVLGMIYVDWDNDFIFLATGVVFYFIMYSRYRNSNARHTYEKETKKEMKNLRKVDNFTGSERGLSNSMISGCNNTRVEGDKITDGFLAKITKNATIKTLTGGKVADFSKDDD